MAWALQSALPSTEYGIDFMSESLSLRTLQLPASGSAPLGPSGAPADGNDVDFQSVLAQQLGAAPAQPSDGPGPGAAREADSDDAAAALDGNGLPVAAPDSAVAAALQGMVQSAAAPAQSITTRVLALERGRGEGENGRSVVEGIGHAEPAATEFLLDDAHGSAARIAVSKDETQVASGGSRSEQEPVRASDPAVRPEIAPSHGVERRAEVSAHHAAAAATPLDEPVSMARHRFASDMGERVLWMAANNRQVAELRLDPPQLGPVEVRLSITGEQANVSLVATHAAVREALQASIPRLQEMIQSIGLELGNVTVGGDALPRQHEHAQDERVPRHTGGRIDPASSPDAHARSWLPERTGTGLVDTYA